MVEYLKKWESKPDECVSVSYSDDRSYFTYKEFIKKFILTNDNNKNIIDRFPSDYDDEISKLNSDILRKNIEIKNTERYTYKELISKMPNEKKEELFSSADYEIITNHYYPLVRFLIVNGLLDETYWYYKGNFDVERSYTLKRNDIIYMKGLMESKDMDIFLDVETPTEIIRRLSPADFSRENILNKKILQACIDQKKYNQYVISITESIDENNKYNDLIKILDGLEKNVMIAYADILVKKVDKLANILNYCEHSYKLFFEIILVSLLKSSDIGPDGLGLFRKYIEKNAQIICDIPNNKFEIFIKNICSADIKFKNLFESKCDKERLIKIEKNNAYKMSIENILFIYKVITEGEIEYGNLLNQINESDTLSTCKDYIEKNFESFICEYISKNHGNIKYTNDECYLMKILKANISEEYKLKYIEKNKTVITNLNEIFFSDITTKILNEFLKVDKIVFNANNLRTYFNMRVNEIEYEIFEGKAEPLEDDFYFEFEKMYDIKFIEYVDRNINENNFKYILSNNGRICDTFIIDLQVSDKVFEYAILYAERPIDNINSEFKRSRISSLIDKGLLSVTDENITVLMENLYNEELIVLVNSKDKNIEDGVISIILKYSISDELIYGLVNSNISDENSLKLIEIISDSVLIEKIKSTKEYIIEYIISRKLSDENIKYICSTFKTFRLKDMFIEELDYRGELDKLDDENLNEVFMNHVLNLKSIDINTKIALIIRKIENKTSAKLLKEYISYVQEISELSNVWNKKRPVLDNFYKEKIGESLIEFGYVKSGRYKGKKNIRLQKVNI